MRIQAQQMLRNPTRRELSETVEALVDKVFDSREDRQDDNVYEMVLVCTPQIRQSPLAVAAGIPSGPALIK